MSEGRLPCGERPFWFVERGCVELVIESALADPFLISQPLWVACQHEIITSYFDRLQLE